MVRSYKKGVCVLFKPLFGHTTGRQSKTIWMCFMKFEKFQAG